MSKPRFLGAFTEHSEKTITSSNSTYADVCKWFDNNPDKENRVGYFVSIDTSKEGNTIIKSTSSSRVLGVTMEDPGFASNACNYMCNEDGCLKEDYAYVGTSGYISVIDNGTCTINGTCIPSNDGTAIPSTNSNGYQVIERIDDTHILILVRPNTDVIQRQIGDIVFSVNNGILEVTY